MCLTFPPWSRNSLICCISVEETPSDTGVISRAATIKFPASSSEPLTSGAGVCGWWFSGIVAAGKLGDGIFDVFGFFLCGKDGLFCLAAVLLVRRGRFRSMGSSSDSVSLGVSVPLVLTSARANLNLLLQDEPVRVGKWEAAISWNVRPLSRSFSSLLVSFGDHALRLNGIAGQEQGICLGELVGHQAPCI